MVIGRTIQKPVVGLKYAVFPPIIGFGSGPVLFFTVKSINVDKYNCYTLNWFQQITDEYCVIDGQHKIHRSYFQAGCIFVMKAYQYQYKNYV